MLALARANQGEVGRRGPAVRGAVQELPEAGALPRLQRRPLPPAARRRGRRAGMGGAGRRRQRARRRRRSWCGSMRCARSGAGATRSPRWRATCSSARTARAAPRRCSRRRRRWKRRPAPPAAVDARKAAPDVTAIYRRVWAEAPLDGWGDRAAERLEQIAAALPAAEAAVVRARTAGELVSRGMVLFDRNRNQESEAAFAAALAAPGPGRRPGVPGALPPRPVGLEAAPAPARRRRCSTRPRPPARARRTAICTRRRCTRGRAATRRRATASWRWRTTRGSRPSTPITATPTTRASAPRSSPPTRATRRPRPSCSPRCRPATRRATCSTRRCGGWRSRPGAPDATTMRCAGWTRTCGSSRARRSGTRRGGPSTGRGASSRSAASPTRRAPGTSAPCANTRCRSMRCCRSTRLKTLDPGAQKALVRALRKGLHDVPAWSFPPRALYGDAGLSARRRAGAHGPGQRRAPRAGQARVW